MSSSAVVAWSRREASVTRHRHAVRVQVIGATSPELEGVTARAGLGDTAGVCWRLRDATRAQRQARREGVQEACRT